MIYVRVAVFEVPYSSLTNLNFALKRKTGEPTLNSNIKNQPFKAYRSSHGAFRYYIQQGKQYTMHIYSQIIIFHQPGFSRNKGEFPS